MDAIKKFYVTIRRRGSGYRLLAGPFDSAQEARDNLDLARRVTLDLYPFSAFDEFGTSALRGPEFPPGILNSRLGLEEPC